MLCKGSQCQGLYKISKINPFLIKVTYIGIDMFILNMLNYK